MNNKWTETGVSACEITVKWAKLNWIFMEKSQEKDKTNT